jgi:RNA polymerase sigma factor for flagellar operon FliA
MNFTPQEITQDETRMVGNIAREVFIKYGPSREFGQLTKEDLFHEGIMGLLEARQNFKRDKGVPWLAFAAFRVRGSMIDALRKLPEIRLPQQVRKKVKELREVSSNLSQETGHNDPQELAKRLGWSLDEVHKISQLTPSLVSIGDTDDDDIEDQRTGLVLSDDKTPDPETATNRKQMAEKVQECLEKIPNTQDRLILIGRVVEGLKLREMAEMVGCSLENIRLMQKKVEQWMRSCLEKHGVENGSILRLIH